MDNSGRYIRLKLKDIIDDIEPESIKAFLIQYASNDKAFEMAFKSHFISRVRTGIDESEKYKKVLEELIKPKNSINKIGPTQKKVISVVLKDFVNQMNDCLSTENYMEAYYLSKESLEKIAYLQNRYEVKDKSIESCRLHMLSGLGIILDKELAPAFRKKIESELIELVSKSYYYPKNINLIELLNEKKVLVREYKVNLIEDLQSKLKSVENKTPIIKTIVQLSHPFDALAKDVILKFNHEDLYAALIDLIFAGKFEYVDFYIDNPKMSFNYNIELLNIFKFIEKEDHSSLSTAVNSIDTEVYSIINLKEICDALPEIYLRKEFDKIKAWIDKLQFSMQSQLYARAGRYNELLALLMEKEDIEWLKVHDVVLIDNGLKKEVQTLYIELAEKFITNHIGKKSREFLEKLQLHLYKIGESNIYRKVADHISSRFDYRISLSSNYD